MNPEIEETIVIDFVTSSPATGAAVDADSTPTCEVFEDATDTAILTPTVVKRASKTGNYRIPITCTSANGFEIGKSYNIVISATVESVAAKAVAQTFQVRAVPPVPASQSSVDAIAAKTANLPTDPADASDIAASFTTVNTKLDTITSGLPLDAGDITAIAQEILTIDWTTVSGEAAYSTLNALRMLRNAWTTSGGVLTVKGEDGTTTAWIRPLTTDPTAQPITGTS